MAFRYLHALHAIDLAIHFKASGHQKTGVQVSWKFKGSKIENCQRMLFKGTSTEYDNR